jgi:hypothetical protein
LVGLRMEGTDRMVIEFVILRTAVLRVREMLVIIMPAQQTVLRTCNMWSLPSSRHERGSPY